MHRNVVSSSILINAAVLSIEPHLFTTFVFEDTSEKVLETKTLRLCLLPHQDGADFEDLKKF